MKSDDKPVYVGPPLKPQLQISEEELKKFRKIYPPGVASDRPSRSAFQKRTIVPNTIKEEG